MKQMIFKPQAFGRVLLVAMTLVWSVSSIQAQKLKLNEKGKASVKTSEDGKYPYQTFYKDPLNTRIYTLKNGLTVYMTVNKNEPRVYTNIAVRTGSTNDPADATGLAHYLEHMLFKGTDRYGSLDFQKEKVLLDKIEAKYEEYRKVTDEAKRKAIYREIDELSSEAAKYAIASEYDKMLSAIGATGTNAYTSFERTVYVNDIPSNQLEKWLTIEGERFRNPQLRLFHTELEAVYEEKNISLDNDFRAAYQALLENVFPKHNYGQQTTIGTIEHLKNPSITKIKEYYNAYYVPNNMAICISGDFDPDATIKMIDKHFGAFQRKDVVPYEGAEEAPIEGIQRVEVKGPEAEMLYMGFRLPGITSEEALKMQMVDMLLSNSTAGLIDLNLVKQQKVLRAYSFPMMMRDYSVHVMGGNPKEGQRLEEIEALLVEQLNKIKKGEFDESMIAAIVNNLEIDEMRAYEDNRSRAGEYVEAFITGMDYGEAIKRLDKMRAMTKKEIVDFANKYYGDNYVAVYKRTGERENVKKVVKPEITPVEVNRDAQSQFLLDIVNKPSGEMSPAFLDYENDILTGEIGGKVEFRYLKNEENGLFTLYYVLDIGSKHDRELAFAINYLPFLGTDKYDAETISKKFFELGSSFDVFAGPEQVYVYLSGLSSKFDESVDLFEHLLANAKPDEAALKNLVANTMKQRADAKLQKSRILWGGMYNYGMYGENNPFNSILPEEELQGITGQSLVKRLNSLTSIDHRVLYYGPASAETVMESLNKRHQLPDQMTPVPAESPFAFRDIKVNTVYFVDYDMVQAEIMWLSRSMDYNPGMAPAITMFNEYYGGNMSSIVFQTIRESKALAYSTFSSFTTPNRAGEPHYVRSYVGTQADKLHEAIEGMFDLLNNIPESRNLFEGSKAAIVNRIETERITRTDILFDYERANRLGLDHDIRKDVYKQIPNMKFSDIADFHLKYVANQPYTLLVMGSKDKIDLKSLEQYGMVIELTLEDLFGY